MQVQYADDGHEKQTTAWMDWQSAQPFLNSVSSSHWWRWVESSFICATWPVHRRPSGRVWEKTERHFLSLALFPNMPHITDVLLILTRQAI